MIFLYIFHTTDSPWEVLQYHFIKLHVYSIITFHFSFCWTLIFLYYTEIHKTYIVLIFIEKHEHMLPLAIQLLRVWGFQLTGLNLPHFSQEPGFPTSYDVCRGSLCIQWFEESNLSLCWYWWNCWPPLLKLSFRSITLLKFAIFCTCPNLGTGFPSPYFVVFLCSILNEWLYVLLIVVELLTA